MVDELRYHNPGQGCIITRAATQAAADKIEALRERVTELEVFTGHLRASRDHAVQANEAAEAREVELAGALARAMRRKLVKQEFINVYDPNEIRGKAGMHSSGRSSLSLADEGAMPGRDAIIIREVYETRYEEREIEDIAKLDALSKKEKADAPKTP